MKKQYQYNARVYSADGDLAQREFIHISDLELFVGDVTEIPSGIFKGEYKIAAICLPKDDPEYAQTTEASKEEFMWTPIRTIELMETDFDNTTVSDRDFPVIFAYPAISSETYEYGKQHHPNHKARKKSWRFIQERLSNLLERAVQNR